MRILLGLAPISAQAADVVAAGAMPDAMLPPPTPLTASQSLYLEVTLNQASRGLLPFIAVDVLRLAVLVAFPSISLVLVHWMR